MSVTSYHSPVYSTNDNLELVVGRQPTKLEIYLQELQMTQQAITETGTEVFKAAREKANADAAFQETLIKLTVDGLMSGQLTVEEGERLVNASQQLMESLDPSSKPSEETYSAASTIETVEIKTAHQQHRSRFCP